MSVRAFFLGTGVALSLGLAAQAQAADQAAQAPSAGAPAAESVPATAADFKPGAVIKDPDGATVGTVVRAGAAANGQMAVVVNIEGKTVSLPASLFTVAGDTLTSSATKAQIEAAIPKG